MNLPAEGWYRDPFGRHQDRWFSAGAPTALVRDGGVEGHDDPPDVPAPMVLERSAAHPLAGGEDLRRADEAEAAGGGSAFRRADDAEAAPPSSPDEAAEAAFEAASESAVD